MWATMIGKAKGKPLKLHPLPSQDNKDNIVGGNMKEISAILKDLKNVGMVGTIIPPVTPPFNTSFWSPHKSDGSWRVQVDDHVLSQLQLPCQVWYLC